MSYYETLPLKLPEGIEINCQILDDNGNKCPSKAEFEDDFFLDSEMYVGVDWVTCYVCNEHVFHKNLALHGIDEGN